MGTRLRHLAISAVAVLCVADAQACGDKLVVLGGGVDFERLKHSRHPGNIILKTSPNSALSSANEGSALASSLELAGHKVRVVADDGAFDEAVRETHPDLVLVDVGEAQQTTARFAGAPTPPAVLGVIGNVTPTELESARASTGCVAPTARKGRRVLQMVEEILDRRSEGLPDTCSDAGPKA
jgi:CheY-like chemotaxis protein